MYDPAEDRTFLNRQKVSPQQGHLGLRMNPANQWTTPGGTPWNDRRNPPAAGAAAYVRQGPRDPGGGYGNTLKRGATPREAVAARRNTFRPRGA